MGITELRKEQKEKAVPYGAGSFLCYYTDQERRILRSYMCPQLKGIILTLLTFFNLGYILRTVSMLGGLI